jgi:hypothetical protein
MSAHCLLPSAFQSPQVKESVLVKDVLRAVQGLTGKYNTFNGAAAATAGCGIAVVPQEQLQIPVRWRTVLHELGELGVMYK